MSIIVGMELFVRVRPQHHQSVLLIFGIIHADNAVAVLPHSLFLSYFSQQAENILPFHPWFLSGHAHRRLPVIIEEQSWDNRRYMPKQCLPDKQEGLNRTAFSTAMSRQARIVRLLQPVSAFHRRIHSLVKSVWKTHRCVFQTVNLVFRESTNF